MGDYTLGYLVGLAAGGYIGWHFSRLYHEGRLHKEKMKFMENFANEVKALFESNKKAAK